METTSVLQRGLVAVGVAMLLAAWPATRPSAQPAPPAAVQIDNDDIGGVVTSKNGPEAGVWVIAETTDLGTRFARSVVTDERGRYVVPDLPKATYNVWVRGYGLIDSPQVKAAPGQRVNLTAVPAPNAAAAAEYYPAIYWFSMDANHTLWLSNNLQNELALVGWVNTKLFWETGDAAQAQGWTPLIVDTNGNGERDAYVEPNQLEDPSKDKRIGLGFYGISYSPADGCIWGSNIGFPGYVLRLQPGP